MHHPHRVRSNDDGAGDCCPCGFSVSVILSIGIGSIQLHRVVTSAYTLARLTSAPSFGRVVTGWRANLPILVVENKDKPMLETLRNQGAGLRLNKDVQNDRTLLTRLRSSRENGAKKKNRRSSERRTRLLAMALLTGRHTISKSTCLLDKNFI